MFDVEPRCSGHRETSAERRLTALSLSRSFIAFARVTRNQSNAESTFFGVLRIFPFDPLFGMAAIYNEASLHFLFSAKIWTPLLNIRILSTSVNTFLFKKF